MQIKNSFPPNFQKIKKAFPKCEEQKAVFCYGDIVHNPFNVTVNRDLEIHEAVHSKQQGKDIEGWWDKYINSAEFRLEQEVQAYGTQLYFIKTNYPGKMYPYFLEKIAQLLSGDLYGNLLSYHQAETRIRCFLKKI